MQHYRTRPTNLVRSQSASAAHGLPLNRQTRASLTALPPRTPGPPRAFVRAAVVAMRNGVARACKRARPPFPTAFATHSDGYTGAPRDEPRDRKRCCAEPGCAFRAKLVHRENLKPPTAAAFKLTHALQQSVTGRDFTGRGIRWHVGS